MHDGSTPLQASRFSQARWQFLQRSLAEKKRAIHVVGLGTFGGNLALLLWLLKSGQRVVLWEKRSEEELLDSVQALGIWGNTLEIHWSSDPQLPNDQLIFVTPAMMPQHAALKTCPKENISTEIELALGLAAEKGMLIHAVTGSVGKSTSASLMATALGCSVYGNIGRSFLSEEGPWPQEAVVEISSYQLHYLHFAQWMPSSALLTPLRDHHALWHGSVEAYQNCKLEAMDRWERTAPCTRAESLSQAEVTPVEEQWQGRSLKIPGEHNRQNAFAVAVHLQKCGRLNDEAIMNMLDFPGLPHRLEVCALEQNQRWINDSKATSPEAVVQALMAVSIGATLILQGVPTGDPVEMLRLAQERCTAVVFIGGMKAIAAKVPWVQIQPEYFDSLDLFFEHLRISRRGENIHDPKYIGDILFSPGGPSYDQYLNYEKRGEHFRRLCTQLLEKT